MSGQVLLAGNLNMNNHVINNSGTSNLATTSYIDSLPIKLSVSAVATADLNTLTQLSGNYTYNASGGTASTGQITGTLATSNSFTIDGQTFTSTNNNTRILLVGQTNDTNSGGNPAGSSNGIYTITISGTSLTLNRPSDFNTNSNIITGSIIYVKNGTTYSGSNWNLTTTTISTVGTIALSFKQVRGTTTSIATSGADVVISTTPPTANQVLVTSSATNISWLDYKLKKLNDVLIVESYDVNLLTSSPAYYWKSSTLAASWTDSIGGLTITMPTPINTDTNGDNYSTIANSNPVSLLTIPTLYSTPGFTIMFMYAIITNTGYTIIEDAGLNFNFVAFDDGSTQRASLWYGGWKYHTTLPKDYNNRVFVLFRCIGSSIRVWINGNDNTYTGSQNFTPGELGRTDYSGSFFKFFTMAFWNRGISDTEFTNITTEATTRLSASSGININNCVLQYQTSDSKWHANSVLPSGAVVGTTDTQALTNKTLTSSTNTVRATQLATTGSDVVISAASAPTTGKILTATSSTTATWQLPTSSYATADANNNISLGDANLQSSAVLRSTTAGKGAGTNQTSGAADNTLIGYNAGNSITTATNNVVIGSSASVGNTSNNVVLGYNASTLSPYTVAIGSGVSITDASSTRSIIIGNNSTGNASITSSTDAVSIGGATISGSNSAIALGSGATITNSANAIGIGYNTQITSSQQSAAIGKSCVINSAQASLAIGTSAQCTAQNTVAIGANSSATGIGSVAIGANAVANIPYTFNISVPFIGIKSNGGSGSITNQQASKYSTPGVCFSTANISANTTGTTTITLPTGATFFPTDAFAVVNTTGASGTVTFSLTDGGSNTYINSGTLNTTTKYNVSTFIIIVAVGCTSLVVNVTNAGGATTFRVSVYGILIEND